MARQSRRFRFDRLAAWLFTIASAPAIIAADPATAPDLPNVILITIDTLRADHLGIYGYASAETPNIDALARAARHFHAALEINPRAGMAAYHLGLSQLQAGESKSAMTSLELAWKLDPANFAAAYNLGVLYRSGGRNGEALRLFQEAVRLNPNYALGHAALGEAFLGENRPADAVRELKRAVSLAPSMRKAYMSLGRAYEALGRKDDAERAYLRAQSR